MWPRSWLGGWRSERVCLFVGVQPTSPGFCKLGGGGGGGCEEGGLQCLRLVGARVEETEV